MQFTGLGGIGRVNRVLWFTISLNTRLRTSNEIVRRYAQVKTVEIAQELIPHIRGSSTFQIFSGVYMDTFLGEALTPNQYEGTASAWEWPWAVRHCRWYDALGSPWRYWTQVLKLSCTSAVDCCWRQDAGLRWCFGLTLHGCSYCAKKQIDAKYSFEKVIKQIIRKIPLCLHGSISTVGLLKLYVISALLVKKKDVLWLMIRGRKQQWRIISILLSISKNKN